MKKQAFALLPTLIALSGLSADAPAQEAPFKQSEILPEGKYPAAYNAPAQVHKALPIPISQAPPAFGS